MEFLKVNIDQLLPASYNPRKNLKELDSEYQKIKRSIEEFGYVDPIIINSDNTVIGGHQRLKVLQDLGYSEVEVVRINLDKTKEKALNIALNKISGEWDLTKLDDLLQELKLDDFDIELTGFDLSELDDLFPAEEKEIVEDDYESELPEEPKSKVGDVYILGNHRLMCGDATREENVKKLMNGEKADMVFTDPPYNTGMQEKNDHSTWLSGMFNDKYTDEEWQMFMSKFCEIYYKVMKENSVGYICLDWRRNYELIPHIKKRFVLSNTIVWDKVVHGLGSDYKHTYELINVCKKGKPKLETHQGEKEYQDIWHIQRKIGRDEEHATKKPIELCSRAIRHASKHMKLVVDLFGGSGSTLIACEQLNRRCFMMELDPKYVDVIIDRWEKYTGKKAIKE